MSDTPDGAQQSAFLIGMAMTLAQLSRLDSPLLARQLADQWGLNYSDFGTVFVDATDLLELRRIFTEGERQG